MRITIGLITFYLGPVVAALGGIVLLCGWRTGGISLLSIGLATLLINRFMRKFC